MGMKGSISDIFINEGERYCKRCNSVIDSKLLNGWELCKCGYRFHVESKTTPYRPKFIN